MTPVHELLGWQHDSMTEKVLAASLSVTNSNKFTRYLASKL